METWWTKGRALAALLGIALFALALRLPGMGSGMAADESLTYDEYIRPGLERMFLVRYTCNNQPLNTLAGWGMARVWGDADWALRLPALLAGLALIPVAYAFMRRILGQSGPALLAALVVALHPYHVAYSASFRSYTMVILFATLSALLLYEQLRRPSWKHAFGLGIALFLMAFSHIVSLLLLAGWGLVLAGALAPRVVRGTWRDRHLLLGVGGAAAGLALGMLLTITAYWPSFALPQALVARLFTGEWPFDAKAFVSGAEQKAWMPFDRYSDTVTGLMGGPFWIAALVAVGGTAIACRRNALGVGVLLASLLGPVAALLLANLKIEPRYGLSLLPFFCLALGCGIWQLGMLLSSRHGKPLQAAVLTLLLLGYATPSLHRYFADFPVTGPALATVLWDHHAALDYVHREAGPRDVVAGSPGVDMSFDHCADKYFRRFRAAPETSAQALRIWVLTSPGDLTVGLFAYPEPLRHAASFSQCEVLVADVQAPDYRVAPLGPVSSVLTGGGDWALSGADTHVRPAPDSKDPEHTIWFEGQGGWNDTTLQSSTLPCAAGRLAAFRVWVWRGDATGDVMAQMNLIDESRQARKFLVTHEPRPHATGEDGWELLSIESLVPPGFTACFATVRWRTRLAPGQRVGMRAPEIWIDAPRPALPSR